MVPILYSFVEEQTLVGSLQFEIQKDDDLFKQNNSSSLNVTSTEHNTKMFDVLPTKMSLSSVQAKRPAPANSAKGLISMTKTFKSSKGSVLF